MAGWLGGWLAGLAGGLGLGLARQSTRIHFGQTFQKYEFLVGFWWFFVLPPCAQFGVFCASSLCSNWYFLCFLLVLKILFFVLPPCAQIVVLISDFLC